MADPIYGGASQVDIYRVKKNSGGTAYEILQATGSSVATNRATAGHKLYTLDEIEQSQLQPQDDGTMQIVLDQYDITPEFVDTILNPYANPVVATAGRAPSAYFKETGVERGGQTSVTGELLLVISYGPLDKVSGATKRLMHWGLFNITKSSGAVIYKDQQYIKPVATFKSAPAEFELDIAALLFHTALLDTATIGAQVIEQYHHFEREYLTKQV